MNRNILNTIVILLCSSFLGQCNTSKGLNSVNDLEEKAAHTLIITYEKESAKAQVKNIIENYKASILGDYNNLKIISVYFSKRKDTDKAIKDIKKIKGVKSVEKDNIVSIQ